MTDTVVDTPAQGDYLSMSDAEIMAAGAPAEVVQAPAGIVEETQASAAVIENNTEALGASAADGGAADQAGDESVKEADTTTEKQAETPDAPADNAPALDYEAEYKRLLAPCEVCGRCSDTHANGCQLQQEDGGFEAKPETDEAVGKQWLAE